MQRAAGWPYISQTPPTAEDVYVQQFMRQVRLLQSQRCPDGSPQALDLSHQLPLQALRSPMRDTSSNPCPSCSRETSSQVRTKVDAIQKGEVALDRG